MMINFIFLRNETRRELERKLQEHKGVLEELKNIRSVEQMVAMVSTQVIFDIRQISLSVLS